MFRTTKMSKKPSASSSTVAAASLGGRRPGQFALSGSGSFQRSAKFSSASTPSLSTAGAKSSIAGAKSSSAGATSRGGGSSSRLTLPSSVSAGTAPPAPSAPSLDATDTNEAMADDGAFFIDLGADLENMESYTNALQTEITGIDKDIGDLNAHIGVEEEHAENLRQAEKNNFNEIGEHLRSVEEMEIHTDATAATFATLGETMQRDLVKPLTKAEKDSDASSHDKENHGKNNKAVAPTKQFLEDTYRSCDEMYRLSTDKKTMEEIQAYTTQVKDEIAAIESTIVKEDLKGALDRKKDENDGKKSELDSEKMEQMHLTHEIKRTSERAGENANGIVAKRSKMEERNDEFRRNEKLLKETLELAEARLKGRKTKEDWTKEVAEVEQHRDSIQQKLDRANDMLKKRDDDKKEQEETELSIAELEKLEQELMAQVAASEASAAEAEAELAKVNEQAEAVAAKKRVNDQFESENILPKEAKLNDLLKEKVELAKQISDINDFIKEDTEKYALEEEKQVETIEELQEQVKELRAKVDHKTTEMGEFAQTTEEGTKAFEEELAALETTLESIRASVKAEQSSLDQETRTHQQLKEEQKEAEGLAKQKYGELHTQKTILEAGAYLIDQGQQRLCTIEKELESDLQDIKDGTYEEPKVHVYNVKAELEETLTQMTQKLTQHSGMP
ncbi:expressed unknown protein [Seminavis robusta]|uniref:Uncharacterized protein n=1 Tax=Seminavis robusta TaxID=568900 RepID=A0A9N8DAD5_9STRA|nr:expressed unknown protein [Seminavis robusta]|eukprot:Sro1_g000480.1 n/a (677) ;mRNA; f:144822-146957